MIIPLREENMDNKIVYIILVNYKSLVHTVECIDSILNSSYKNVRIIVVDNNSSDGCKAKIDKRYQDVIVIESEKNVGFSAANNIGIKMALKLNAAYVLLLNNDTILDNNCISELIRMGNLNKKSVITGKILNYYDKKLIWYGGADLNFFKGDADIYGFGENDTGQCDETRKCTFASGCCMLIPTEIASKYFLPEQYFLYYEDVDFCTNLFKNHVDIIYDPAAVIYHKESISTDKNSHLYTYYFSRNRFMYISNNINGMRKLFAYMYSMLWVLKKIIQKKFDRKYALCGIHDCKKGYTKDENTCHL